MSFWDLFKSQDKTPHLNNLHEKLIDNFPDSEEDELVFLACLAGLMARVAHVDFNVSETEIEQMKSALMKWVKLDGQKALIITKMAIKEMKEFQGLDTRDYCRPLVDRCNIDQRYEVLITLFSIAASDGSVDINESNEIHYISNSLNLEKKHFIAARATIMESLKSLK